MSDPVFNLPTEGYDFTPPSKRIPPGMTPINRPVRPRPPVEEANATPAGPSAPTFSPPGRRPAPAESVKAGPAPVVAPKATMADFLAQRKREAKTEYLRLLREHSEAKELTAEQLGDILPIMKDAGITEAEYEAHRRLIDRHKKATALVAETTTRAADLKEASEKFVAMRADWERREKELQAEVIEKLRPAEAARHVAHARHAECNHAKWEADRCTADIKRLFES